MIPKITNFKLCIGFPCSWPFVPFPFFHSFVQMERPEFMPIFATNGPIDGLRNKIVEDAKSIGASRLFMPDLDQTYPVDTITKLLAHNLPVVGAMVHRRYPPFDPLMLKGNINSYYIVEDWKDGDLVEVDATGSGCLMYDMRIFHELLGPWFKFRPNPDPEKSGVVGEDIGFCSNLRKAGYKIHVDTSIKCGHLSTMEITEETYWLFKSLKKKQEAHNGNKIRKNSKC